MSLRHRFSKKDKLKSRKTIETLFDYGSSFVVHPLRMVYKEHSFNEDVFVKAGVSVSKKHFKKAVDRNRIKRLMREAYRLNKAAYFNNITTQYALMILYIGSEIPDFNDLNSDMKKLLERFLKSVDQSK